ncbi:MAG: HD domain-containing protein [Planctomycetota bacterium]|jgi:putative nucleotidyltransferase with HDIG domain
MIGKKEIEELFGEFLSKIKDKELREKTVKAWVLAAERGGWKDLDTLRKMPFTLLTDCRGVTFIEHTIAVTRSAIGLGKAQVDTYEKEPYPIDFDRLIAGGLLHDVGKLLECEPDGKGGYRKSHGGKCARHPISGAVIAGLVGLSDEIINTIACHSKEGDGRPQVVETVLIHQADFATFNPLVMLAAGKLITGK